MPLMTDYTDEDTADTLEQFKAEHHDSAASDHDLVCQKCQTVVCTIEIGDTLADLARVAFAHTCT